MDLGDESAGHVAEDEVTDLASFIRTSRSSFIPFFFFFFLISCQFKARVESSCQPVQQFVLID